MKKYILLSMAFLLFVVGGFAILNNKVTKEQSKMVELNVSAAASLKDVLGEIKTLYEKDNPNVKIVYNFGASGNLRNQIEQGANVDIFISAAVNHMNELEKQGFVKKEDRKNLVENDLVLIKSKNNVINNQNFEVLLDENVKKIAMGEPKGVPAGQYALQVCEKLNLWDKIKDKIVFASDVRSVLAYVETENVDLGMVYKTDAFISDKVDVIATAPKNSHEPILYPLAIVNKQNVKKESKSFFEYLLSDDSKDIFRKYGFEIPGEI